MRPISAGSGQERYTLYFPVRFGNKDALRFPDVLAEMTRKFGVAVSAEEKGADLAVIKAASFPTKGEAEIAFEWLKKVFDLASIESDVPIHTYDRVDESVPMSFKFPSGWPRAAEAGWVSSPDADGIVTDGVVNIVFPTIVPEHLKIVDQDALVGTVSPRAEADAILRAIASASAGANSRQVDLACASYVAALSHQNSRLRFLGFVTCLEVLAVRKDRDADFKEALDYFADAGAENSRREGNAAAILHSQRIRDILKNAQTQAIAESIEDLLKENWALICAELPNDHPYRGGDVKRAAQTIYRLRSKVAHEGSWGEFDDDKTHRAYQFVRSAAKSLLRRALRA